MVARADNRVIGKDKDLVWHLPADLKYFKKMTTGHHVIMGRKTFESFGNPLPNRKHVVITRNKDYDAGNHYVVGSLEEAFDVCEKAGQKHVFVLGGGEIYKLALNKVDRIYLTEVHDNYEGDTYFPEIDPGQWKELSRVDFKADEKNKVDYSFVVLEPVKP